MPNRDVRDMAEEIAIRSGHDFVTSRTLFDGKRFALAITFPFAYQVEVRVGDPLSIGMALRTSYDGSQRLSASLFVHRLACSNGMIAPQLFGRVRFRHVQKSAGWEEEVSRVMSVLSQAHYGLKEFAASAVKLANTPLTAEHLKQLRKGVFAPVPMTLWSRMVDQTLLREEHTLYGLLNGGTAVTWHDPKMTVRDLEHNETLVRGLLSYARPSTENGHDEHPLRQKQPGGPGDGARRDRSGLPLRCSDPGPWPVSLRGRSGLRAASVFCSVKENGPGGETSGQMTQ